MAEAEGIATDVAAERLAAARLAAERRDASAGPAVTA
jgi:hypothetical protein